MEQSGVNQTLHTETSATDPQPQPIETTNASPYNTWMQRMLLNADVWFCGKKPTRLPMADIAACDGAMAERIAKRRQCEVPLTVVQTLGSFLIMHGLKSSPGAARYAEVPLGIALSTFSSLTEMSLRTKSGDELADLVYDILPKNGYDKETLTDALLKAGVDPDYADSTSSFPRILGQLERGEHGSFGVVRTAPILATAATLPPEFAIAVATLGTIGTTVAGRCLRSRFDGRKLQSSIARTTGNTRWRRETDGSHARTLTLNQALETVPSALAQLAMLLPGGANPHIYAAISSGTKPIASSNEIAYYRTMAEEEVRVIKTFLLLYNSKPYIFSQGRLAEHCSTAVPCSIQNLNHAKAITADNIVPHAFPGEREMQPVTFTASIGHPVLLSGRNGLGKSNLMRAVAHTLEHTGLVTLTENEATYDIHGLGRQGHAAINAKLALISRDRLPSAHAITDLFIAAFEETHQEMRERHLAEYPDNPNEVDVAYKLPEYELGCALKEEGKTKGSTTFPRKMFPMLHEISETRHAWLSQELKNFGDAGRPIAGKDLTAGIGPMSDGQKATAINLLAAILAPHRTALLLDEPTANLDREMIAATRSVIQKISRQTALVIISHENQDQIVAALPGCELVELHSRP